MVKRKSVSLLFCHTYTHTHITHCYWDNTTGMTHLNNIEWRSCNHCCSGKAVSVTYSKCVSVALVTSMQCASSVLYCHPWSIWLYHIFPHYVINGTIFERNLFNTKCVFWYSLQLLSEIFIIPRRILRNIITNVHTSSCKVPVFCQILKKLKFNWHIFEELPNFEFHYNPTVPAEFHANVQTCQI